MKRNWKTILLSVLKYTLAIIAGITCANYTINYLIEKDVIEYNFLSPDKNAGIGFMFLLFWTMAWVLVVTKKWHLRLVGVGLAVVLMVTPVPMAKKEQETLRIKKEQSEREMEIWQEKQSKWQSEAKEAVRKEFGLGNFKFGGVSSSECNLMMVRVIQGNKWAIYDYDVEQKRIVRTMDEAKFRSLVVPHLPQGLEMWEISFTDNLDWINFNYRDGDKFYKGRVFVRDGCKLNLYSLIFLEDKSRKTIEIDVNVE